MERRELFVILAATALPTRGQAETYLPKFFTPAEASALDRLADIIIPADGDSPGAHEAGVIRYIDLMVNYSDPAMQGAWRAGISAVEAESQRRFGGGFATLEPAQQQQIVASIAENEGQRGDALGRFFVAVKRMTVEAYHYSAAHWRKNLGRDVNVSLSEFQGCTHPEHQSS